MKQKKQRALKSFFYLVVIIFFIIGCGFIQKNNRHVSLANPEEVLGKADVVKQIYIFRDDQNQGSNGLFPLLKGTEPAIWIIGDGLSGEVDISVYQGDDDALKRFLVYKNKEDSSFEKKYKTSNFNDYQEVASFSESISEKERRKVILPINDVGIWMVRVKQGDIQTEAIVLISDFSALVKEGDDRLVFWAQDQSSGKSLSDVSLEIYNLREKSENIAETKTNSKGIAEVSTSEKADVAILKSGSDTVLVPLNLSSLDYRWASFTKKIINTKYFTFTDRPLYRPGDKVNFKSILRNDDDAIYSIFSGKVQVSAYSGWGEDKKVIYEKTIALSDFGTINDTFNIPVDAEAGGYYLEIDRDGAGNEYDGISQAYFSVQEFRKPEYSLDIKTEKDIYIAGDSMHFTVKGEYFSGEALAGEKATYEIRSSNFYEYDYADSKEYILNDKYRYYGGYWGRMIGEGEIIFNQNGEAEISVYAQLPAEAKGNQVVSIEVNFEKGGGEPVFDRKNVLMYAGDFGIYRKSNDWSYSVKIGEKANIPLTIIAYDDDISVKDIQVNATGEREYWEEIRETENTPLRYERKSEILPEIKAISDRDGNLALSFTPEKFGSYQYNVRAVDKRGNTIYRDVWLWVPEEGGFFYSFSGSREGDEDGLSIKTDKESYKPNEKAKVTISSIVPDRDVFLSMERGRMDRYVVVDLNGKSETIELDLVDVDMPNRFLSVATFTKGKYYHSEEKILVSAEKKRINLEIKTDRQVYGPGDNISIEVNAKDQSGKPLEADIALFGVDKAIYELADNNNGDIFEEFYRERYNDTQDSHSLKGIVMFNAEKGCFGAGTKVLLSDGTEKAIEDVKKGDFVLTRKSETENELVSAQVIGTHNINVDGVLIINSNLRVTPNHKMFVNNKWMVAGDIQIGDILIKSDGSEDYVDSIEWLRRKTKVYNLTIKDSHTYFADGVWVHNSKGDGDGRSVFRDTAYWNPSIRTGANGKAKITFRLPDNLTTWVLASYAETKDSKVGQAKKEIKVTKSVILRPTITNIFRVDDEVILSVLLQNFSGATETFLANLEFASGKVIKGINQQVELADNESKEIYFTIVPEKEIEDAELTFSAIGKNEQNVDRITLTAPIYSTGYQVQRSVVGSDKNTVEYKFSADADPEKSILRVSLAPNILGTIPDAMEYLVGYPYGCIEQTMSRLVPLVIAQKNKDLYQKALEDKNTPKFLHEGLLRLEEHQLENGGFSWWWKDGGDPFISWYVAKYLAEIKSMPELEKSDVELANKLSDNLINYLQSDEFRWSEQAFVGKNEQEKNVLIKERQILRTSGLGFFGQDKSIISDFSDVRPELLAIAVLHNAKYGIANPNQSGLSLLLEIQKADSSGGVYWEAGPMSRFGSNDASTAFALQALVSAGDTSGTAEKAARFLGNNRHKNYWSNTFATAQVIEAITAFTQKNGGANPHYSYQIFAGEKMIARDLVNDFRDRKEASISLRDLPKKEGTLSAQIKGEGVAYLIATVDEFRTKKDASAEFQGIKISREYIPENGKKDIGIGDTVLVRIKIENLSKINDYMVVRDELPAGLVPINREFKNTQGVDDRVNSYSPYGMEIGKADVTFATYGSGRTYYEYSARAVAGGSFFIPPVQASFMYSPEVYGISSTGQLKINIQSEAFAPISALKEIVTDNKTVAVYLIALLFLISSGIIGWLFLERKKKNKTRNNITLSSSNFSLEDKKAEDERRKR